MIKSNLLNILHERGLIAQITHELELSKQLTLPTKKPIILYCGFDPTADSLHLGHLVPLLCLKRFQQAGHKPIVLIGGATGIIGDPSFKFQERKLNSKEIIQHWVHKIKQQISKFLDFNCGDNSALIVNNYDWLNKIDILTFLRDIGKYFSVNQMINKEAVKHRLNRTDHGISFTEFSYNLLQSYDFAHLNQYYGVTLQIGGSDQWGNITSGIELIHRLVKKQAFGLTVPLITKSDGSKFGKTEEGTIWLDPKKTSPYKFYQFWINVDDNDVYNFLKLFTFLSIDKIKLIELEDKAKQIAPIAQHILADNITQIVHNVKGLDAAKRITNSLFLGAVKDLTLLDFKQLEQDGMPKINFSLEKLYDLPFALCEAKLASSRNKAKVIINSNAVSINGKKQLNHDYKFVKEDQLFGHFTLLKRGKKNFCLIIWK